jgi:hypothetical protein
MVLCIKNCNNIQNNQNYDINQVYHPYLNSLTNQRTDENNLNQTVNNDRRLNLNINNLSNQNNVGYVGNNHFDNMAFNVSNDNLNNFKYAEDRLPTYDEVTTNK